VSNFFGTPWTVACQTPLPMGLSQQEFWSGLPCFSPGDLPNPGVEPMSLASPALAGGFFTTEPPGNPKQHLQKSVKTTHRVGEDIYLEKKTLYQNIQREKHNITRTSGDPTWVSFYYWNTSPHAHSPKGDHHPGFSHRIFANLCNLYKWNTSMYLGF